MFFKSSTLLLFIILTLYTYAIALDHDHNQQEQQLMNNESKVEIKGEEQLCHDKNKRSIHHVQHLSDMARRFRQEVFTPPGQRRREQQQRITQQYEPKNVYVQQIPSSNHQQMQQAVIVGTPVTSNQAAQYILQQQPQPQQTVVLANQVPASQVHQVLVQQRPVIPNQGHVFGVQQQPNYHPQKAVLLVPSNQGQQVLVHQQPQQQAVILGAPLSPNQGYNIGVHQQQQQHQQHGPTIYATQPVGISQSSSSAIHGYPTNVDIFGNEQTHQSMTLPSTQNVQQQFPNFQTPSKLLGMVTTVTTTPNPRSWDLLFGSNLNIEQQTEYPTQGNEYGIDVRGDK